MVMVTVMVTLMMVTIMMIVAPMKKGITIATMTVVAAIRIVTSVATHKPYAPNKNA